MKSNWFRAQQNWVHCPDPLLDRGDWSFKGKTSFRQHIPKVKHIPTQGLRLEVRLLEAAVARKEWDKRQAEIAKEQERQRLALELESVQRRLEKLTQPIK